MRLKSRPVCGPSESGRLELGTLAAHPLPSRSPCHTEGGFWEDGPNPTFLLSELSSPMAENISLSHKADMDSGTQLFGDLKRSSEEGSGVSQFSRTPSFERGQLKPYSFRNGEMGFHS